MYPALRFGWHYWRAKDMSKLELEDVHEFEMRCHPGDIDFWMEMNNGRVLTLYDIGRLSWMRRVGAIDTFKDKGWGITVAGSTPRYRRRVRLFNKFRLRTGVIGRDERFIYMMQSMWLGETCCNSALLRLAATDESGIVATDRIADAFGRPDWRPELPRWVQGWIDNEVHRTWPPEV
ncbi:acyl-CoA thioesterase [Paracoccaceae bacterium GXU_MW_L88]